MKTTTLVLILFLTALGLWAQTPSASMTPGQVRPGVRAATNNPAVAPAGMPASPGFSAPSAVAPASVAPATASAIPTTMPGATAVSPDSAAATDTEAAGITFNYEGVDVGQVLDVYADLMGRTLIRGNVPQASIVLKTQSPLTRTEAIEALQAVLALNGIAVINIGEKFVKVVPPDQANSTGAPFNNLEASQLPEMGSYVTHIVQLKHVKPTVMQPIIQPFGRLANSVTPIDDNGILVIRDYAENVKRMLEMIAKIDVSVPAVYISEVIPIRYAKVDDIANALNSLGGSGGATVAVGGSPSAAPISGLAGNRPTGTGMSGMATTTQTGVNGVNTSASPFGQPRTATGTTANPNGTPSSTTPFQTRLLNIINNASGTGAGSKEPIQLFGQTKIIPNESSSSLLIYATREDMDAITNIIAKLDVPLSQVLIEAVIMDYSLGPDTLNFGVSAVQNQKNLTVGNTSAAGAGGYNNGQTFFDFINSTLGSVSSNATTTANPATPSAATFGNSLSGGLSYFGSIGPTWEVAMSAAAADSHATIIQRPRIQTSQATPAQFFVGDTVPYVTGNTYGSAYGNTASYSQLSVGVELDVTPFINPDGLVVMQIQQEIDDLNGYTAIANVGNVPNTIKRTLNAEIAVRDKDTVMLGGFIKNSKSTSRSGVPLLQDIPFLGSLFSQRSSSKAREELLVLMRPTVLKTPEIAAFNTIKEKQRLPGISDAAAEENADEQKLIDAQRKKELKNPKSMSEGFYNNTMPTNAPPEQLSQPQVQEDGFTPVPPPDAPMIPADFNNAAPPVP